MMRKLTILLTVTVVACAFAAADPKLTLKDLPPAVQKTVQDTAKGAEIKNISKETEKGVSQFEVETILN